MPPIPADVLPRLRLWWHSQEPGNQAIEALYLDAPGVVSTVISGGEWVADGAEPGLAAQLGDSDFFSSQEQIPALSPEGEPEIPMYGVAGSPMTIRWSEHNGSSVALGDYVTDVYVQDQGGSPIVSARLDADGVEAGASAAREWTVTLPADAEPGPYNVRIYMNAEGSDVGSGVAGASRCDQRRFSTSANPSPWPPTRT